MMFGKLGDLTSLLKSAGELQERISKLQEESANRRFEAQSEDDRVRAVVDGRGMLVDIKIEPQGIDNVEPLEEAVRFAVRTAITESQEAMKKEMADLTGGLSLPGMDGLLGSGT